MPGLNAQAENLTGSCRKEYVWKLEPAWLVSAYGLCLFSIAQVERVRINTPTVSEAAGISRGGHWSIHASRRSRRRRSQSVSYLVGWLVRSFVRSFSRWLVGQFLRFENKCPFG